MIFSIIIPAYNAEKYLGRCVESIINQSYRDFECIIVDDGSIDGTGALCDIFTKKDKRIRVIHKKNQGVILARKNGADVSSGDYILCIDSDDTIDSDLLKEIYSVIIKHPNTDLICYGFKSIKSGESICFTDNFGEGLYQGRMINVIRDNYLFDSRVHGENQGAMSYSMWSKAFRREIFDKCIDNVPGGIRLGEDMLFVANALNVSSSIYVLKNTYYNYYIDNTDSATHKYELSDIKNGYLVFENLMKMSGCNENRLIQAGHFIINYLWNQYILYGIQSCNYKTFSTDIKDRTEYPLLHQLKSIRMPYISKSFSIKRRLITHERLYLIYLYCKLKFSGKNG